MREFKLPTCSDISEIWWSIFSFTVNGGIYIILYHLVSISKGFHGFFQAQATTDLIFPYGEGWWNVVHDLGVIGADKLRVDDAACGAVNNVAINFAVPIYCCVGS